MAQIPNQLSHSIEMYSQFKYNSYQILSKFTFTYLPNVFTMFILGPIDFHFHAILNAYNVGSINSHLNGWENWFFYLPLSQPATSGIQ